MFCPHCGKDIENGSKSCSFCNKAIDQEYTAPPGMQDAKVSSEFSLENEISEKNTVKTEKKNDKSEKNTVKTEKNTVKN